MKRTVALLVGLALASCGVDGEPVPPEVSVKQTIGVDSSDGPFSKTTIGFKFGG